MKINVKKCKFLYLVKSKKLYFRLRSNLRERAEWKKVVWTCHLLGNYEETDEMCVKMAITLY